MHLTEACLSITLVLRYPMIVNLEVKDDFFDTVTQLPGATL